MNSDHRAPTTQLQPMAGVHDLAQPWLQSGSIKVTTYQCTQCADDEGSAAVQPSKGRMLWGQSTRIFSSPAASLIEIGTHYRSPCGRSGSPTARRWVSAPPVRIAGHPPGSSGGASAPPGLATGEGNVR
jgi:hypothetical protein